MAVISIASTESSIGKSTCAAHLAHGMALTGLNTLLVDFTDNHTVSKLFDVVPAEGEPSAANLLDKKGALDHVPATVIREQVREHLDILPANDELTDAARDLKFNDREFMLVSAFHQFAATYDIVFVDTSPRLNLLTRSALLGSDVVVYPISDELSSAEGLQCFFAFSEYYNLSPRWLILRAFHERGVKVNETSLFEFLNALKRQHHESIIQLADRFPEERIATPTQLCVMNSIIHRSQHLAEHSGKTATVFDEGHSASRSPLSMPNVRDEFMDLVEEVSARIADQMPRILERVEAPREKTKIAI